MWSERPHPPTRHTAHHTHTATHTAPRCGREYPTLKPVVHFMALSELRLGDLLARACEAMSMRSPSHELVDALNSDVPRQALIDIISATNFNMDDSGGHMDDSGRTVVSRDSSPSHIDQAAGPLNEELVTIFDTSSPARLFRAVVLLSLGGSKLDKAKEMVEGMMLRLEERATQRQAQRRQPSTALHPIALQQLSDPGRKLSPAASRECLASCIAHGQISAARANGKRLVVVLGNTGAGKSAFVNFLHGCTFGLDAEDRLVVAPDSPVPEVTSLSSPTQIV